MGSILTRASLDKFMVKGEEPEDKKPSLVVHPIIGSLTSGHIVKGSLVGRVKFSDVKDKSRTKERASVSPFISFLERLRAFLRGGKR